MLYHRQVTPLDLFIGRQGLELIGNFAASAISFLLFYMMGVIEWPHDYALFLTGFFYMGWWSCQRAPKFPQKWAVKIPWFGGGILGSVISRRNDRRLPLKVADRVAWEAAADGGASWT